MSGLKPEFKLAELDLPKKVLARIERVRETTLPQANELHELRERAEQEDVFDFADDDLTINLDGKEKDELTPYRLEHELTATTLGAIGFNILRQKEYRLLWLIDGRTIETVRFGKTESYIIYADGLEIGNIDIKKTRKAFFIFNLPIEWVIRIGDADIIGMHLISMPAVTQIHLEFLNKRPPLTWIGTLKQPSIRDELSHALRSGSSGPETRSDVVWFLPRDDQGQPFADTLDEQIALMSFSLLLRNAFTDISQ